jgi:hypothetical protein
MNSLPISMMHAIRILLLLTILVAGCGPSTSITTTESVSGDPSNDVEDIVPTIRVQDQEIQDGSVKIEEVVSLGPGWLAIYTQEGGVLGRLIGYESVRHGSNKNLEVEVNASDATDVLYATLHIDAGMIGLFEFPGPDRPAVVGGTAVAPTFNRIVSASESAQAEATEDVQTAGEGQPLPNTGVTPSAVSQALELTIQDQELVQGTVKADLVVSAGPGWLVIYNQSGREPGEIIGFTSVQQGENRDDIVEVDASKATETLFAVLHADAGEAGKPEFADLDKPVTDGTRIILATFMMKAVDVVDSGEPLPTPVSSSPSIAIEDQEIRGGTLKAVSVNSPVQGFFTIHNQTPDGTIGPVIGWTGVEIGENKDIIMNIDVIDATETCTDTACG